MIWWRREQQTYAVLIAFAPDTRRVVGLHHSKQDAERTRLAWSSRGPTEIVRFTPGVDLPAWRDAVLMGRAVTELIQVMECLP